jgi:hypothetical protein
VRIASAPDDTNVTSFDKVARHTFGFIFQATSATAGTDGIETTQHTIRCDSTPYFRGPLASSEASVNVGPGHRRGLLTPHVPRASPYVLHVARGRLTLKDASSLDNIAGSATGVVVAL